jgi:uncharacterized protein YaeQ
MAIKATIFKAELEISDIDRDHYEKYSLTIARHPSETDERMMVRLYAFASHADEHLEFTKGISTEEEPALWKKNLTGEIESWIEVGQPDEKRLRKACGRAAQVYLYCYGSHASKAWWQQMQSKLNRFDNLNVFFLKDAECQALSNLAQRTMNLQCTIQDSQAWLADNNQTVHIIPETWMTRRK